MKICLISSKVFFTNYRNLLRKLVENSLDFDQISDFLSSKRRSSFTTAHHAEDFASFCLTSLTTPILTQGRARKKNRQNRFHQKFSVKAGKLILQCRRSGHNWTEQRQKDCLCPAFMTS